MGLIWCLITAIVAGLIQVPPSQAFALQQYRNATIRGASTYNNPVFDADWPDPYVYLHTDLYYYMTRSENNGIAIYKTRDLTNWRGAARSFVYAAPSGLTDLWAPEMHYIQGVFYTYFALDDG